MLMDGRFNNLGWGGGYVRDSSLTTGGGMEIYNW